MAILEDGRVAEVQIERRGKGSVVGHIWKGRVESVLAGMEASFIEVGIGKNGQKYAFHNALPIETYGELDGKKFKDIREFKKIVAADERQLARNIVGQLAVFATGAPVGFSDRPKVEAVLDQAKEGHYGVRDLVHGLVSSDLFLNK